MQPAIPNEIDIQRYLENQLRTQVSCVKNNFDKGYLSSLVDLYFLFNGVEDFDSSLWEQGMRETA